MEKNEFTATTKQWLKAKGFSKARYIWYFYPLGDFNIVFAFYKDRFDEKYYIETGFCLNEETINDGLNVRLNTGAIEVPNKKYWNHFRTADNKKHIEKGAFYYEKWDKDDYLATLEQIYAEHITPYLERGVNYLKAIVVEYQQHLKRIEKYGKSEGNTYMIHPDAVKIINNM